MNDRTTYYLVEAERLNALAEIVFSTETRQAIICRARRYEALAKGCKDAVANTATPPAALSRDAA